MGALRSAVMRGLAAVVLASLALGCLGRSPQVRLYKMSAVPGSAVSDAGGDLAVGVGPVRLPRYLDRPQLVKRVDESRLDVDEFNRWAGGFASNFLRALGDDLGTRLATQSVVVYPADAPFPLDYRIVLDVQEFEGGPGRDLTLRTRWVIRESSDERAPATGQSLIRVPVGGGSVEALVAAHDEAVGRLADAIASRVVGLASERAEPDASAEEPPQPSDS